mgnify:CR=1 FL=1
MTPDFQIISDGSCDLPVSLVEQNHLQVVPFYVSFDSTSYKKEGVDISVREFYDQMVEHPKTFPKSSMPSAEDYRQVFEPLVQKNIPIICICITTKFSGSMQSAVTARDLILEDYPDARICVIDATVNTVLQGLLVLEAAKMQQAGWSYEETIARINEIKSTGRIFFTIGNIDYLKHGGRIGKLSALAGSVLGIRPLITLKEGEIFPSGIARSRNRSLDKVMHLLLGYLKECKADIKDYSLALGYGYDLEEGKVFRKQLIEKLGSEYPVTEEELPLYQIGAGISVHTGPYALGIGIIRRFDAK